MPDEVQKYLRELPFKVRRQLAAAIKREADSLAAAIKKAAPRRTGALAESVRVRRRRNETDLEVVAGGDLTTRKVRAGAGVTFDYSIAAEYGTQKQQAEPFFYSTYRAMEGEIRANIEKAVNDALK